MTTVRIYQPCQSAMQAGKRKTKEWRVEFETRDPLSPDPLMGWVSSIDMKEEDIGRYAAELLMERILKGRKEKRVFPCRRRLRGP